MPPGDTVGYRAWTASILADGTAVTASRDDGSLLRRTHDMRLSLVLLPNGSTPSRAARATLASVVRQSDPRWELWMRSDRASGVADQRINVLEPLSDEDGVGWFRRVVGHASGVFIVPLPAYAQLSPDACHEIAATIARCPDFDLIYSDEDALDEAGARLAPRFKPAWDPESMSGHLIGHVAAFRAGRLRDMISDVPASRSIELLLYELALRITGTPPARPALHIPRVLCSVPLSAIREALALDGSAARETVAEHLARQSNDGIAVIAPDRAPAWSRIVWPVPNPVPRASVIVPTRDQPTMLARCAEGVLERGLPGDRTPRRRQRIGRSVALDLLRRLGDDHRVRVLRHDAPFNFSQLNNLAARGFW